MKTFHSKHFPGHQVGFHIAKVAYYEGYHKIGESNSLKSPSKTTLQRRRISLLFTTPMLSAMCQTHGLRLVRQR